jgi:hypothetical protein
MKQGVNFQVNKLLVPLLYTVKAAIAKVAGDEDPKDTVPLTVNGAIVAGNLSILKARLNTFFLDA